MIDYIGQQWGNYHLIRLLGRGGFADVYLGEHVHMGTPAAIKILTSKLSEEDMKQFRDEARIIYQLAHPHIIPVLDFGLMNQTPFTVMRYASGGTLRKLHPRGTPVPSSKVVHYVKQIANALQYAHENKIIHRDIKPENILLNEKGELLVSDFGIAAPAHSTRSLNTQDTSGTVYYMAPEQIQGKPRPASDQYALGIVVYEWLSGGLPFVGTAMEVWSQHLFTPPISLREKNGAIPTEVDQAVIKALAKDPRQRYPDIQAFAVALEQATLPLPEVRHSPNMAKENGRVVLSAARFFLPFSGSDVLLTQKQFEEWCQQNVPGYPVVGGSLRFDGLYCAIESGSNTWLRFYPDGTVLSAAVVPIEKANQVARWLGKNHEHIPHDNYKQSGTQIGFTTRGAAVVDQVGIIVSDEAIFLESYSHATRRRAFNRFDYHQVTFPV